MAVSDITDQSMPPVQNMSNPDAELDMYAGYVDYYGFDDTSKYMLPDGRQYIEFKPMNEGERAKYEAKTSRDVSFNRRTDDARIKMDPSTDRWALISASVTGWHLVRKTNGKWQPVAFSKGSPGAELEKWLQVTDPRIVNYLVDAIRKANPWMTEDMTVEMIDEEMNRLKDLRDQAVEREASGKVL